MIARLRQGYAEAYGRIAPSGCFDWREKVWLVGMRWRSSTPPYGGVPWWVGGRGYPHGLRRGLEKVVAAKAAQN